MRTVLCTWVAFLIFSTSSAVAQGRAQPPKKNAEIDLNLSNNADIQNIMVPHGSAPDEYPSRHGPPAHGETWHAPSEEPGIVPLVITMTVLVILLILFVIGCVIGGVQEKKYGR